MTKVFQFVRLDRTRWSSFCKHFRPFHHSLRDLVVIDLRLHCISNDSVFPRNSLFKVQASARCHMFLLTRE